MDALYIGLMKVEVQQAGRQREGPLNLQKERLMERKLIILATAIFLLVFASSMAPMAGAEEVGSFTQVVKTVDHLKGGKPPAQPAKVDGKVAIKDGVELFLVAEKIFDKFSYIVKKGSVTLNGISLTVVSVGKNFFTVAIIPFTWKNTMLCNIKVGDCLNIETDILGKYLKKFLNK